MDFAIEPVLNKVKAQKNRVAHTGPDGSADVCINGDVLNENCIDRHTDDNEKRLECQCKQERR
jgi:hypothetical protein